jgi:multidrug efflux system membrane fusion protein
MKRLRILFLSQSSRPLCLALAGLIVAVLAAACGGNAANGTAAGAGAAGGRGGRGGRGAGGGAQPVVTARVSQKDVPVDIAAVGNVEAFSTIAVRSQVTGNLDSVSVTEGNFVKKDDVLFTIDKRPLEELLEQAQANMDRDVALLAQSEAQLARDAANAEYQQLAAERQAQLVGRGIISKDVAEQARSQADATGALVKADKAAIESARSQLKIQQSQVQNAKVQLSYAISRSPINGRLGDILVKAGNLVTANTTQITTISQVEPIFVTFSVPATHLPTIRKHTVGSDKLSVVATPQDAEAQPVEGKLTFVDSVVDQNTDTVKLKALFTNTDHRLWPGQFARVSLRLETLEQATVVPQQAVQTGQEGQFVFVVSQGGAGGRGGRGRGQGRGQGQGNGQAQAAPAQAAAAPAAEGQGRAAASGAPGADPAAAPAPPALTVEQRPVTVGQRVGDEIVVEKGLRPGELVVTEGQLRLEDGTRVQLSDADGNLQAGRGRGGRGGRGRGQGDQGGQGAQGGAQPAPAGQQAQPAPDAQGGQGRGQRGQ